MLDLIGQKFGRLLVKNKTDKRLHGLVIWDCICDCGKSHFVTTTNLVKEYTKSCGCLKREKASILTKKRPFEYLYNRFIQAAKYKKYEINITYEDFLEFVKIKNCHYCDENIIWNEYDSIYNNNTERKYNLDRKDNNIGYTKENCVVCCARCNKAKSNHFTHEEWKQLGDVIKTWDKK